MKKIITIAIVFILFHVCLFLLLFNYESPQGILSFEEITATEQKELSPETDYDFYVSNQLLDVLNDCEFESLKLIEAISVLNESDSANIIETGLIYGESFLFQNREYLSGKILIFDANEIYYCVTYKQTDPLISEIGFSYTVYKVKFPTNAQSEILESSNVTTGTNLKNNILNMLWYDYTLVQKKTIMVVVNLLFLFTEIIFVCIMVKKRFSDKRKVQS